MAKLRKTWTEKASEPRTAVVKKLDFPFAGIPAGANMLISTPEAIAAYLKQIPAGKTVALETLRNDLAIDAGADYTCPVTTGIFLRIVAEAALEKYAKTHSTREIAPFWRVIGPSSPLGKKLTCGSEFIGMRRTAESKKMQ